MRKVIVGISQFPPLIMNKGGKFFGFEVELWERIARAIGLEFEFKETKFKNLLEKLRKGEVDVAIAGISRTSEREEVIDFSHFTLRAGLQILVSKDSKSSVLGYFFGLLISNLKKIFLVLFLGILIIYVFANFIYWAERGNGLFSASYFRGIGEAMWWAVATVSTVGYGDFVPRTGIGRVVGTGVIFFGYAIFGLFIAKLSSLFTLDRLKHKIETREDLKGKKVATKSHTTSVEELSEIGAKVVEVEKIEQAYKMLGKNDVDAVVFDAPAIKHFMQSEEARKFTMVGDVFAQQTYGFAVPEKSELREPISREILKLMESGEYDALYNKWFGDE